MSELRPTHPSAPLAPELLGETRTHLEGILARFEAAWRRGERPSIGDYLADVSGPERAFLLAELVHEELELRLRADESARVEDYLARFPALRADPAAELLLIAAEFRLRRRLEPNCDPDEYLRRFPARRAELVPVLDEVRAAEPTPPNVTRDTPHLGWSPTPSPDPASPVAVAPPPRLLGEYELGDRLGGGGMGVVYRARHRRLGKSVAIKLLAADAQDDPERVTRFVREMQAVGGLKHPNVVEAYDAGEQGGVVYLAMELVEGTDLNHLVEQRGPLSVAEACELVRQAAVGLQYLHERGLVHRDLKPSNLMRTADGVVKILDLGLARWAVREAGGKHTGTGEAMGTPDYLAPEQVEDAAAADVRADLYGLGGTLFYLLTGRPPFAHRRGMHAKLMAHLKEPPPDVRSLRPAAPTGVAELVGRLLAKRPEGRPATPAEVAARLAEFTISPQPLSRPAEGRVASIRTRAPRSRGWTLGALLLAGLLGLGGWAWLGRPTQDTTAPSPVGDGNGPVRAKPKAKPLTIRLRIFRLVPDGGNLIRVGELGGSAYRVRLQDRVEPEATLSEPAFAYLIAFNPADKPQDQEQFVPESEAGRAPGKRKQISPDVRLNLNDGVGLQVFAVVASRQPLPAYSTWRKQRPSLGWRRIPGTSGMVWQSDGEVLDGLYEPGFDRATEETAGDKVVVRRLARTLRHLPGIEAVAVVGFAVDRPK